MIRRSNRLNAPAMTPARKFSREGLSPSWTSPPAEMSCLNPKDGAVRLRLTHPLCQLTQAPMSQLTQARLFQLTEPLEVFVTRQGEIIMREVTEKIEGQRFIIN